MKSYKFPIIIILILFILLLFAGCLTAPMAPVQGPRGLQGPAGTSQINLTANMTANMTAGPQGIPGLDNLTANMTAGPQGPQGIQGIQGIQGPAGATGAAATANANYTFTLLSGENANVTNVGTTAAALFDFFIPTGATGPQGIQGIQGIQGPQGDPGAMNQTINLTANMTANMTAGPAGAPGPDNDARYLWINGTRAMTGNLSMGGYNISNVLDPVAAQDAATKNYVDSGGGGSAWSTWSPSLSWTTGTPSGVTTIARYTQVGKIVHFTIDISSVDSNGCTGLTITLPVAPANNGNRIAVTSIQRTEV